MNPEKVRVRTPLFLVHITCALVMGICVGILIDFADVRENFKQIESIQGQWRTLTIAGLSLAGVVGLAAALLELAVWRGYDPKRFRKKMYGVTLADMAQSRTSHHVMLYVLHRDGNMHEYRAEPGEAHGLKVGDVLRLDVFGEHVVGVRRLESKPPTLDDRAVGQWFKRRRRFRPDLWANWVMLAA